MSGEINQFYLVKRSTIHTLYEYSKNLGESSVQLSDYIANELSRSRFNYQALMLLAENEIKPFYEKLLTFRIHSTPFLHFLIKERDFNLASQLVFAAHSSPAHSMYINQLSEDGTPLHVACLEENYDIARLLLDYNATPSLSSPNQETALHIAASKSNEALTQLLLDYRANTEAQDSRGETPLHRAVISQSNETVRLLSKCKGLNIQNNRGHTALAIAAAYKNLDVIHSLLGAGANRHIVDLSGTLPLHIAASKGHVKVMQLLAENLSDLDRQEDNNTTPYLWASMLGYNEVQSTFPCTQSKEILTRKAIANIFDIDGVTQYGQLRPVELEGFKGVGWVPFLIEIIDSGRQLGILPISSQNYHSMIDILNFYKRSMDCDPSEIVQRLRLGLPTLIPFSYNTHDINLFIFPRVSDHDHRVNSYELVIVNRGELSTQPLEVWTTFNYHAVNTDIIREIQSLFRCNEKEYIEKRNNIKKSLQLYKVENNLRLESACTLDKQYANNCSWVSLISSLWPYFAYINQNAPQWVERSNHLYEEVNEHAKLFILNKWMIDNYGDLEKSASFFPLINHALSQINRHSHNHALQRSFDLFCNTLRQFVHKIQYLEIQKT